MASEISVFPSIPMKVIFYLSMILTAASGIYYYRKNKGGYLFSSLSAIAFLTSIMAILSFISVYFYELPTHHCPFCILQKEYGYIGYPLYLTLLGGTISGVGVGVLMPFRDIKSLSAVLPSIQKKLTIVSLILFGLFVVIVTYRILFSGLILEGH